MSNVVKFPESETEKMNAEVGECREAISDAMDGRHEAACVAALASLLAEIMAEFAGSEHEKAELLYSAIGVLVGGFQGHSVVASVERAAD